MHLRVKALLRFNDGSTEISTASSSEDLSGNVFVLERIEIIHPCRGKIRFEFSDILVIKDREIAEYREIGQIPLPFQETA